MDIKFKDAFGKIINYSTRIKSEIQYILDKRILVINTRQHCDKNHTKYFNTLKKKQKIIKEKEKHKKKEKKGKKKTRKQ